MTDRDIVETHLALTRRALTPSAALSARVHARLAAESAASGAAALAATPVAVPSSPWRSLRASGKAGATLGAGLLVLGFASGYFARGDDAAEPPPLPVVPVASVVEQPSAEALSPIDEETARVEVAPVIEVARAARSSPPAAASADSVALATAAATPSPQDELALLKRAERAVRAGNAALALALIGELEERYPRSRLLEERRAIELLAHCDAKATDASTRAARFLREHPRSVYAGRISTLCPAESTAGEPAAP